MPAIITTDFRVANADAFVQSITEQVAGCGQNLRLYTAIGRSHPWDHDVEPPTPVDNTAQNFIYWADALAAKRISGSDVITCIPRYQWRPGNVYVPYSHTMAAGINEFYVMTSNFEVYKCIDNNGGAVSTVEPNDPVMYITQTLDGYRWKYMFTVNQSDALRFLTPSYIPVRPHANVVLTAIDGTIDRIQVTNGGSGYLTPPLVTIVGNGTGAAGTATIEGGVVTKITMSNAGANYRYATVTLVGGDGMGAAATAIMSPKGGHGSDPATELGAFFVAISTQLDYDDVTETLPRINDYRRIMLLRDPEVAADGTIAAGPAYRLNRQVTLQYVSGVLSGDPLESEASLITTDDTLTGETSGAIAYQVGSKVVSTSPLQIRVDFVQNADINVYDFAAGETVYTAVSGSVWTVVGSVVPSQLIPETGKIIFVENRRPIMRSPDQIENIIIICEF